MAFNTEEDRFCLVGHSFEHAHLPRPRQRQQLVISTLPRFGSQKGCQDGIGIKPFHALDQSPAMRMSCDPEGVDNLLVLGLARGTHCTRFDSAQICKLLRTQIMQLV